MRKLLETPARIEIRRQLVGKGLIVNKAVCPGRADSLFVEAFGVKLAALDPSDLRTHQCGTVFEILRTILLPLPQLTIVICQSFKMLLPPVERCGIPACRER